MSDAKVQSLVLNEIFRLPPADAGDPFNFINEALLFLSRWSTAYAGPIAHGSPAYACLVGCERINTDVAGMTDCQEKQLFKEDTPADFLGKIYYCSHSFAKVFARTVPCASFSDCEAALAHGALSGRPVVFYNAAERRILWRLNGTDELKQMVFRPPSEAKLTTGNFEELLEDFHHNYTETPQGFTKPWSNANTLTTKPRLEEEIRDDLFIYLKQLSAHPMAVLREFHNSAGRTDLLIWFQEENKIFYVELKVLRGRVAGNAAKHIEWGKEGIAQAYSYRRLQPKQPGAGYACCFDARDENKEIPELVEFAKEKEVQYRRYFMFPSAKDMRITFMN